MSRLADLLNDSTEDPNSASITPVQVPDDKTRMSPHHRQSSISSPLEALLIDGQPSPAAIHGQTMLANDKELLTEQQTSDNVSGTVAKAIDINLEAQANHESLKHDDAIGSGNESRTEQIDGLKPDNSTTEHVVQPLQHIKKEDSQDLASIRGVSPSVSVPSMPLNGPPKKKAPGGPRKPSAKKRKLDTRADTPQSQRSGTPNSILGGKSAPRLKKQNSTTPLNSSPGLDEDDDEDDESDSGLYCICRKGDDHTWMIGCDGGCDDWFHGRCIGIDQRDGNLIDKFICPNCSESKGAETTWKTMCRLDGCREPAAITAPRPSKYCCDDHAAQFFRRFIKKGLGTDSITTAKKRRKENMTDNFQNYGEDYSRPAHLRGGLLSAVELKAISDGLQSCKDFRSLGESVPVIDEDERDGEDMDLDTGTQRYTAYESEQLEKTINRTEKLRHQLKLLENRERFLALVKSRAKSALEEFKKKDKSMKDMCGFDRRLRWSDEDFYTWCISEDGMEAFKSNKLQPDQVDADGDDNMGDADDLGKGICLRKRCKQHEGWFKLHSLEFAYGKSDASREISRLAAEERGIRERATIRHLEHKAGTDGVDGYL